MKVLFLCRGNVGRSQMAEALFNEKYSNTGHSALSAGTELSGPEQSLGGLLPKTRHVIDVLKEEGIDTKNNTRKHMTDAMLKTSDKVVCLFDPNNGLDKKSVNTLQGTCDVLWDVPDPKNTDLKTHRKVKDQIKELIESMNL